MIDVKREISKFKPIDLSFIPGRYAPTSDQMYESFVLYNKALHQIQLNKEDAAKNYLRKATALFPDFYEANMVLGILIFSSGDRIGAVRIFNSISDNSKREDAIKFLDHLVQEAEKPATARPSAKISFADRHMVNKTNENGNESGRATEREVLGGRGISDDSVKRKSDEARYSRGRVFEKGGNFYEPQETRKTSGIAQKRYGQIRKDTRNMDDIERARKIFVDDTDYGHVNKNEDYEPPKRVMNNGLKMNRSNTANEKTDGKFFREQLKDANDLKLLNKCMMIIIAILLLFTVIVSTIIVNRTAEVKRLNDKLTSITSDVQGSGD